MIIKEYRIVMPLTVEEYWIGQLYVTMDASLHETGGREGVEVIKNEPFVNYPLFGGLYNQGQYTLKKYHLTTKIPMALRMLSPKGHMKIQEESWNAFPYCKTVITYPIFDEMEMEGRYKIVIESLHCPDRGEQENVHVLTEENLQLREVVKIDIAKDPMSALDYKPSEDPKHCERLGRGPLVGDWIYSVKPVMTCYKLVTVQFDWFGLQERLENFIHKELRRLFTNFHRQVFCSLEKWHRLTIVEIRLQEKDVQEELEKQRITREVRGMVADEFWEGNEISKSLPG